MKKRIYLRPKRNSINRMRFDKFIIPIEARESWLNLCPENSWRVVLPFDLPEPVPQSLACKCDSVFVMTSGSRLDSVVYYMANLNRRDRGYIDQMPFGFAIITGSWTQGFLVQHGNWGGRTSTGSLMPPRYFNFEASQTASQQDYFATLSLPQSESGSLEELSSPSNHGAFKTVVGEINDIYKINNF